MSSVSNSLQHTPRFSTTRFSTPRFSTPRFSTCLGSAHASVQHAPRLALSTPRFSHTSVPHTSVQPGFSTPRFSTPLFSMPRPARLAPSSLPKPRGGRNDDNNFAVRQIVTPRISKYDLVAKTPLFLIFSNRFLFSHFSLHPLHYFLFFACGVGWSDPRGRVGG